MPGKTITCLLCGKSRREARSKYTQICTIEREEKIRTAYGHYYNQELYGTLLNQLVHSACYKSPVSGMEPVSTIAQTGRTRLKQKFSNFQSNSTRLLKHITNNPSSNEAMSSSILIDHIDNNDNRDDNNEVSFIMN